MSVARVGWRQLQRAAKRQRFGHPRASCGSNISYQGMGAYRCQVALSQDLALNVNESSRTNYLQKWVLAILSKEGNPWQFSSKIA